MHVEITEEIEASVHGVPDRFFVIDHEDSCFTRFAQITIAVMCLVGTLAEEWFAGPEFVDEYTYAGISRTVSKVPNRHRFPFPPHVAVPSLSRGFSKLRQYTGQRQSLTASVRGVPATSVFVAVNILFFLGVLATGGTDGREGFNNLLDWGAKYGPLIADGEYWRLAMPMFLHVGFFHVLTNLFGLVIFGSMVERIFGPRNFVAIYLAAGIAGNVASFVAGPNLSVGASGAVFGIFGAFGAYLLLNRRLLGQVGRQQLTSIGVIVAINIVFGLSVSGVDNAAHIGGLIAGASVAFLVAPRERLVTVASPFSFVGTPRMALQTGQQPTSRLVLAVVVIAVIAAGLTFLVSQTYVADFFGNRVPG